MNNNFKYGFYYNDLVIYGARIEYDAYIDTLWLYVGKTIITHFNTKRHDFKYVYTNKQSNTILFKVIAKEEVYNENA